VEKLKVQLNLYERQIALVENVATRKVEAAKQALAESESAGESAKLAYESESVESTPRSPFRLS
jgi:hypothetical protein